MNTKCCAFLRILAAMGALISLGVGTAWAGGPWFVSPSGNDGSSCLAPGTACLTIGGAIGKASSGDTINVAAGTYAEQVVIDSKSLTLIGSGAGTTTIQAPAVLTNDPDGAKTVVLFTGPITAAISGFTIQGPVNGLNFGIYVRAGATASIHDNTVKDIRDAPLSGAQIGVAIEVGKSPDTAPVVSQTGTATITNNQIYGYQKTGIAVENTGSSAAITGNTITGAGPITTNAQNGIQIRRGATGTVRTNTVTGNAYDGPTSSAEGIGALHAGSGVVIQGNIVNHNSANIYAYKSDGVQILDNQVSDSATVDQNASAGIFVGSNGTPSCCGGSPGAYVIGVTISGNTVRNNLSGPSIQSDGIDLAAVNGATVTNNTIAGSSYDGIWIGGSGNITITGNQFSGNGLLVSDPNAAAIDFGGGSSLNPLGGFSVHQNSFVGNRNGIWNYDVGSVNATCNWWGAANGPGPVGPGSGDPVSTNVNFTPFLSSSNLAGGCTADPGTSTVSASPPSVVADGTTTSTITVTLLDSVSNPVSGKTVTLAAGSGSSVISAASGPSDASGVVTFTVKDAVAETVTYTAHDTTDSVTLTPTAAVTFTVADLTITKSHTGNFRQGDTGDTYTITVSNPGPGPTFGTVTVSDTLPAGLTPTAPIGTVNGWTCGISGQTLTCTRSDVLASAGSYPAITLTVNVANNAAAGVTNTVTVSGGGESNAANDTASDPTTVVAVADVSITKSVVGGPPFAAGANRTYTVSVVNSGPGSASNVTVTDVLPAGTTFVSATPSQGSCSGTTTVTCTIGALVNGGSATISLVLTTPSTPGAVSNTAAVTATELDPNPANNSSTSAISTVNPSSIPAVSDWALIALAGMLALLALVRARA